MLESVLKTIREFGMIRPGDKVVAGCSGGADSTALVLALKGLSETLGCVLSVAHLNHCLRGRESDMDEQFVRGLAEGLGLPCFVERAEVGRIARQKKTNPEAQAREARLRFFESLRSSGKADLVALAHTADDQAETVLQRVLRGTGTRGLGGIHPVVEIPSGSLKLIRPLIQTRREFLRKWLTDRGQSWREDASNQDPRWARNRIRHQVLPLLESFNPRIVETLARTAALARDEEDYWHSHLRPIYESWVHWEEGRARLDLHTLGQASPAVAYRVLRWVIGEIDQPAGLEVLSQPRPIDFLHVKQLYEWSLRGQSGQRFSLPKNVEARKEFSHLIIQKRKERDRTAAAMDAVEYCYTVGVPSVVEIPVSGLSFRFEFITLGERQERYNERGTILLDAKLADSPLLLRSWQPGDAYRPQGHRSPKKLQDLFQRQRIPVRERAGWPVLWTAGQVVWARGFPVATGCSPPPEGRRAIAIHEIHGDRDDGARNCIL